MTEKQLADCFIKEFGALGGTSWAYEKFLHVQNGSLPKTLEHTILPGTRRKRYCPLAVAKWYTQGRVKAYEAEGRAL